MLTITPDMNKEEVVTEVQSAISVLECYPGKEKVQLIIYDDKYSVYELKQKVDICPELLELLYAIDEIGIDLS